MSLFLNNKRQDEIYHYIGSIALWNEVYYSKFSGLAIGVADLRGYHNFEQYETIQLADL